MSVSSASAAVAATNSSLPDHFLSLAPLVPVIDQYKEALPTGCESVATTMMLAYVAPELRLGAQDVARIVEFEAEPLPHDAVNRSQNEEVQQVGGNPHRHFVGSPFDASGYGMFHEVVADLLQRRIFGSMPKKQHETVNQKQQHQIEEGVTVAVEVLDLTGTSLSELLQRLVDLNAPIVVWTTLKQQKPYYKPGEVWRDYLEPGTIIRWLSPEHCLTLVGYDLRPSQSVVIVNDPDTGKQERYDLAVFQQRYESLGRQAVAVRRLDSKG